MAFLAINTLIAQVSEVYFDGDFPKIDGRQYVHAKDEAHIYIGTGLFDNYKNQPCIMKLDTDENILWRSSDNDEKERGNEEPNFSTLKVLGDHVYASVQADNERLEFFEN